MAACQTMQPRCKCPCLLAGLFLIALMSAVSTAHANTYCVGTTGELQDALVLAANISGSHSVRLRKGVYGMTSAITYTNNIGGDLSVSGGWNSTCSSRGNDPYETVINADANGWIFRAQAKQTSITVELLHFLGSTGILLWDDQPCGGSQKVFRVSRLVIDNSTSTESNGLYYLNDCHRIEVENSLIMGGALGVNYLGRGKPMRFVNNTIIGAVENGLRLDRKFTGNFSEIELYNNIVYGHMSTDVYVRGGNVNAIANTWGEILVEDGGAISPGSFGNLTSNPQLSANGRPVEPGSPSINSGYLSIPGGLPNLDIEGNSRLIGSKPDRGAFETPVSDSILISVTDPNDSGPGTLRQAILTANASPGPKGIQFNIPGACPQSIFLQSPLPLLSTDALLTIDGYSQPGSSSNTLEHGNNATLCIQIRKSGSLPSLPYAIRVPDSSTTLLRLYGLAFGGVGDAVSLAGGSGHLIQGNRFGDTLIGNNSAVTLFAGSNASTIGGNASNAYRNTIADSSVAGILVVGSTDNEISNNYIGTNSDGEQAAPNSTGISISGSARTRIANNVISGNLSSGIVLSGAATTETAITSNRIGIIRDSSIQPSELGNSESGIRMVSAASNNQIGGVLRDSGNVIANNGNAGVAITSGNGNTVFSNQISGNGGLGIDLEAAGVLPNDDDSVGTPPDFANRGLNYPILFDAGGDTESGTVNGELSSTRGGYLIRFFLSPECDASGHGEGDRYIGTTDVILPNLPGQHTVAFAAPVESLDAALTGWISATATDSSGNTSEFSACLPYVNSDVIFADDFD